MLHLTSFWCTVHCCKQQSWLFHLNDPDACSRYFRVHLLWAQLLIMKKVYIHAVHKANKANILGLGL